MKKYDVFISYSRKDMNAANALCKALDDAGIDYWIDRNIHGSANFLSEITRYISRCKVVLFIASVNSAKSEWTQKELLFALKHRKKILPYRIGDFSFDDNAELDLVFANIQWIESLPEVITAFKMLSPSTEQSVKIEVQKTTKPLQPVIWRSVLRILSIITLLCLSVYMGITLFSRVEVETSAPYKVGDYYNENGKQGVVFEVSADGISGKIVSMIQSEDLLEWASDKTEQKSLIGADSKTDGAYNTAKVKTITDWQSKYPAFKWCTDLGEEWYLPAKEELEKFTLDDTVRDAVNQRLKAKGGTQIFDKGKLEWYWSSTEENRELGTLFCAWGVYMYDGLAYNGTKDCDIYVRAVAVF